MTFMICLETDRQLGSFTTPQLLPSYRNCSQALPQTADFRASEERYLLLGTVSLKFRAKASWGSQSCFSLFSGSWQLSCSLFSIVPDKWAQVTFWENDGYSGHSFLTRCAGGWDWL